MCITIATEGNGTLVDVLSDYIDETESKIGKLRSRLNELEAGRSFLLLSECKKLGLEQIQGVISDLKMIQHKLDFL